MLEKSVYGIIVNSEWKYLIVSPSAGTVKWLFPGGHIDPKETELDCLKRELYEECKIKDFDIVKGFREEERYINSSGNERVFIVYLIKVKSDKVSLSNEHKAYLWETYSEVSKKLPHDSWRRMLEKAEKMVAWKKSN